MTEYYPSLGTVIKTIAVKCSTRSSHRRLYVRKVVDRVAYARNGNHGNPTISYRWEIHDPANVLSGLPTLLLRCSTLREARRTAVDFR